MNFPCGPQCSRRTKLHGLLAVLLISGAATATHAAVSSDQHVAAAPANTAQAASSNDTRQTFVANAEKTLKELAGLSELNTVATNLDAVFVLVPSKTGTVSRATVSQLHEVARKIEAQAEIRFGVFGIKTTTSEYNQLAGELPLPGVLVCVKGRGMVPVTGEITEGKLIQAFVRASSAGGCGAGGCGPRGCN